MKPRTKLQQEVWSLHQTLSNPNEHEDFVINKFKFYYATHYKNLICLECNHNWKPTQIWHEEVAGVECPSCKKKLEKITTERGCATRIVTYSVAEVVGRFQVFRHFSCSKHMNKNQKPDYWFKSLFEEWKDWEKNKSVIVGRTQSWSGDGFSYSDYEIRDNSSRKRWGPSIYDSFASDYNCPNPEFLPRFDKYGIKEDFGCDYRFLLEKLENHSRIETLLKSKQKSLLVHAVHKELHTSERYWQQIKIAIRHKYQVKDAGIWYDYLDLLKHFGKDINNPKFILPKNLKKEHNAYVQKKEKIRRIEAVQRELRRQENERLRAEADEVLKNIKQEVFKDFSFKKGEIKVVCLINEEDVKQEGEILKHCVYAQNYHKKSGILLMSARIDGKPIETLEISLSNYSIIQCRGYDNEPTEYHDEIIAIVRQNMGKISRIIEKNKNKKLLKNQSNNALNQVA